MPRNAPFNRYRSTRRSTHHRRGAISVLAAMMVVIFLAMVAFALDIGYAANTRTELMRAVDAGSLAGAGGLIEGPAEAIAEARKFLAANAVAGRSLEDAEVTLELGQWDPETKAFSAGGYLPTAVRVMATRRDAPFFFARALGHDSFDVTAESIATFQPRDIMLVLDYSASMNDDSELRKIATLGQQTIENNLYDIYFELGAPVLGSMQWEPAYIYSTNSWTVRNRLGLADVDYPYPKGSWSEYFNYVQNDGDISNAGYRKKYGYLTLVNYLLETRPGHDETPDLWRTSEQPLTALKNSVTLFLDYLDEPNLEDRVGLTAYTSADSTALVESGLTYDFYEVDTLSRQRQAGHYDRYTNIGDGIRVARESLVSTARAGALKLIVLITDGVANRPSGIDASAYALNQAELAAEHRIPILTISLGSGADYSLMDNIASATKGVHFNIPGGQAVAEYEADLKDVFREIAKDRPLKLVR